MFNDVGKELKGEAKKYVNKRTTLAFLSAFAGGLSASYILAQSGITAPGLMYVWIILMVVVTVSARQKAKMQAIRDYAFGQVVEDVRKVREMVEYDS